MAKIWSTGKATTTLKGEHANKVMLRYKYPKPGFIYHGIQFDKGISGITANCARYGDKILIKSRAKPSTQLKIHSGQENQSVQIEGVLWCLDVTPKLPWLSYILNIKTFFSWFCHDTLPNSVQVSKIKLLTSLLKPILIHQGIAHPY